MTRFYFCIKNANVYECIMADTFMEAKKAAFADWSQYWNQIEWLSPITHKEVRIQ